MSYIEIKGKKIGEGRPKICVPITGKKETDIIRQAREIVEASKKSDIDIVEFRGDFFEGLNDMEALEKILISLREILGDIVLLFTIRSNDEGGEKLKFKTPTLAEINQYVISNKLADIVDVELFSGREVVAKQISLAKESGVKIILSNHDFEKTPETDEIVRRLCMMRDMGSDIAKIAVMPQNKKNVMELLTATTTMNEEYGDIPVVAISMGKLGAVSRICGQVTGSAITFATVGDASAPGQIPADDLSVMLNTIEKYCE